jgi:hypothetical protein
MKGIFLFSCRTICFFCILLLAAFSATAAGDQDHEALTPADVLKMASVISPVDAGYAYFAAEGSFTPLPPFTIFFRLLYRQPGDGVLGILDGSDKTPLLILSQREGLIYDPLQAGAKHFRHTGIIFDFGKSGDEFALKIAFKETVKDSQPVYANTIRVDIGSLLASATLNTQLEKTAEHRYLFSGHSMRGGTCIALVDPAATIPFRKMAIYPKSWKLPILAFTRLDANIPIDASQFDLPWGKLKGSPPEVHESKVEEIILNDIWGLADASLVRAAVSRPELRQILSDRIPTDFDWESLKQRDARVSRFLRDFYLSR